MNPTLTAHSVSSFKEANDKNARGCRTAPSSWDEGVPIRIARPADGQVPCPFGFNALMIDVLERFANCTGAELDAEVQSAFGRICEYLKIESGGLWRHRQKDAGTFTLEHLYPRSENVASQGQPEVASSEPELPSVDSKACFPWLSEQVSRGRTIFFSGLSQLPAEASRDKDALVEAGILSGAIVPFFVNGMVFRAANFTLSTEQWTWTRKLVERLKFVTQVFGSALVRSLREQELTKALSEVKELKSRLDGEGEWLKGDLKLAQEHGEIIGRSQSIRRVLRQVEQVAPVDCTVLITGETGTGKELIARAIHRLSSRSRRGMVMLNCAALPAPLVESELFGRERGAFTGALTSEVGRFEAADGSTIFLDEIGELTPEIQVKLLRVLQEREFQRLGSPKTRKVDVRVIAATNKDLAKEVREGRFREDLYYRLRVFPITVPPLRERMEDLPFLVSAFVEEFASRMSKQINRIPRRVLDCLEGHSWPGNIRELRNIIERGVILSPGETLVVPNPNEASETTASPTSLADVEREHILKTLGDASWRVKGPYGAARRLQLNPSTLYSRMAKLGIHRPLVRDGIPT